MFHGWTNGSVYYVRVSETYRHVGEYYESLFAKAKLLNERYLGAVEHIEFIKESLSVYGKNRQNLIYLSMITAQQIESL